MGQCKSSMRGPEHSSDALKFDKCPILGPLHLTDDLVTVPILDWEEFESVVVDWSLVNELVPFSIVERNNMLQSNGGHYIHLDTCKEILDTFKGSPDNLGLGISCNQSEELVHDGDTVAVNDDSLARLRNAIDFWSAFQPCQDALDHLSRYPNVFSYTLGGKQQALADAKSRRVEDVSNVADAATADAKTEIESLPLVQMQLGTVLNEETTTSSDSGANALNYEIVIKPRYKTIGNPVKEYTCITRIHPPSVPNNEYPLLVQEYIIQCIGDFLDPYQVDRLKRQNKLAKLLHQDLSTPFGMESDRRDISRRPSRGRLLNVHDSKKRMMHLVNRAPNKMCSLSSLETIDEYPTVSLDQGIPNIATLCQEAARVLDETCCVSHGHHGPFSEAVAIRTVLKNKFGDWSDVPLL